jgi:hypothetical protein
MIDAIDKAIDALYRKCQMSEDLYKIGSMTHNQIAFLTFDERKRALFLYRLVYNPELPIGLEDPVWAEIGKLWQLASDRLAEKVAYPEEIEQQPWYLQGKLSAQYQQGD